MLQNIYLKIMGLLKGNVDFILLLIVIEGTKTPEE